MQHRVLLSVVASMDEKGLGEEGTLAGAVPVAAGCWERPLLSFKLCCSMRVNMAVLAAASALAPYDITCINRQDNV